MSSITSTFLGASYAFKLNTNKELLKENENRIAALRVALFTLVQQQNALSGVWRLIVEWQDRGDRAINMPAFKVPDYTGLRQNLTSLTFMLDQEPQLLMDLSVEDERFFQSLVAISGRGDFHVDKLQPVIESSGVNEKKLSLADIKDALGERIYGSAVTLTDEMFSHVRATLESVPAAAERLFKFAKSEFPDEKFIKTVIQ